MRPEFHSKGVTFLSYFDQRAAIEAQSNLAASLVEELGPGVQAACYFSVMLHAANFSDESKLELKKLPSGMPESDVESIFSRYGQLLSIQGTANDSDFVSFVVEYFNIQDARVAASELSATSVQTWGVVREL